MLLTTRHHGIVNNPYYHPADDQEVARLDELQYVIRTIYGCNVLAPITKCPGLILDVGAGSGRWAIEVADEYPGASVIGLDLAPIESPFTPENCEFRVGDLSEELDAFDDGSMDLVHSRFLHAGVTRDQWPLYIQQTFRILQPGKGWAQFCEMRPYDREKGSVLAELMDYMERLHHSKNFLAFEGSTYLVPLFEAAGFVDIQVIKGSVSTADPQDQMDPKRASASRTFLSACSNGIPSLVAQFQEYIPDEKEREEFVARAVSEFQGGRVKNTFNFETIIGRKPCVDVTQTEPSKRRKIHV